jgi:predicted O-linked N-acetylglucosamine transferase (SPINDLY family)
MAHLALVGVCKSGPEVFERIDAALFKRLGIPDDLITETVEAYVDAAVNLANDHSRRVELRKKMLKENAVEHLFGGNPKAFGEQLVMLTKSISKSPVK